MGEIIMTTLNEMIQTLKTEYPTLRIGDEDAGYTDLTPTEYEAQIADWAENRLAKEAKLAEAETAAQAKAEALDKLTALGIDPKALGL
jgi:hypothetical protein